MKQATIRDFAGKPLEDCTRLELFNALMRYTADAARAKGYNEGKRKLYYISAEFLIGKLLGNNLINLGLYDAAAAELAGAGLSLAELEEFEAEPCPPTVSAWPTTAGCSASACPATGRPRRRTTGCAGARRAGCGTPAGTTTSTWAA